MAAEVTNRPADAALRPRRGGRPVNEELRGLAVAAVLERGMSAEAAARHFRLAANSVRRWIRQFRECGHVRPETIGGSDSRIEPERERLFRILAARPTISMYGLRDALAAEGLVFHATTVQRFLKRHRLERDRRLARLYRKRKAGRRWRS